MKRTYSGCKVQQWPYPCLPITIGEGSPVDTAMQAAYTGEKGSPAAVAGTEGGLAIEPRLPRESEGRRGG